MPEQGGFLKFLIGDLVRCCSSGRRSSSRRSSSALEMYVGDDGPTVCGGSGGRSPDGSNSEGRLCRCWSFVVGYGLWGVSLFVFFSFI